MSARIIHYVYVIKRDLSIHNGWGFDSQEDAEYVKKMLIEHYESIYHNAPHVFCKPNVTIVYDKEDEIFMNRERYTLSAVNYRINSLKRALKTATTPKEVLMILGEPNIEKKECLFCCGPQSVEPPTHYVYSLHERIYNGPNIHMAEMSR